MPSYSSGEMCRACGYGGTRPAFGWGHNGTPAAGPDACKECGTPACRHPANVASNPANVAGAQAFLQKAKQGAFDGSAVYGCSRCGSRCRTRVMPAEQICCACSHGSMYARRPCSLCAERYFATNLSYAYGQRVASSMMTQIVGFDGSSHSLSAQDASSRDARLRQGRTLTLYHQTSAASVHLILARGFEPGKASCTWGSAMYFAESALETCAKAHHKGWMVEAQVRVGNVLNSAQRDDQSMTGQRLLGMGYDAVRFPRTSGHEWVVYWKDQVAVGALRAYPCDAHGQPTGGVLHGSGSSHHHGHHAHGLGRSHHGHSARHHGHGHSHGHRHGGHHHGGHGHGGHGHGHGGGPGPRCARPGCPCTSTWNGQPGGFCCNTCRHGTACTANWHPKPSG